MKELEKLRKDQRREALVNSDAYKIGLGIWVFAEGAALLVCALFSIYQARYGHFPTWGKDTLAAAGVLVVVPAAILLSKFFRNVGSA